jgi:hypothetical protein
VVEWCLTTNEHFCQLYHDDSKLHVNEMIIMKSTLLYTLVMLLYTLIGLMAYNKHTNMDIYTYTNMNIQINHTLKQT